MPAVNLSPVFQSWQGFTAGGLPLAGGFINTYIAGTSTPQTTYTTSAGSIANSNPIQLGPDGRPPSEIWLVSGVAYKFILTDSLGLNPLSYDNISGIGDFVNLTVGGNTVLGGAGNTLNVAAGAIVVNASGNTALGGNLTVANNTTLGDASTDLLTINPNTITLANNPTVSGNITYTGALSGGYAWAAFTPTISFGGASVGVTYSIDRSAISLKVGKQRFFHIQMVLTSKGSSTGQLRIAGLPEAPAVVSNMLEYICQIEANNMTGLTGALVAIVLSVGGTISIVPWGATGSGTLLTDAACTNSSSITISGSYPVA